MSESESSFAMAVSHMRKCVLTVYNLSQAQGWFIILCMILDKMWRDPYNTLWNAKEILATEIMIYQALQAMQWLDVVFPLIGFTRTVVINAFLQTTARSIFGFISLPMHYESVPLTLPVLICFALGEWSRYSYNLLQILNLVQTRIGRVVAHLRWNLFLVLYPIGAFGDGLAGVLTIGVLKAAEPMPYSVSMPNKGNFAFNMAYFFTVLPFMYMAQFPINFGHLLRKRREFYAQALLNEVKNNKMD